MYLSSISVNDSERLTYPSTLAEDIFEEHEGTHILQSLDGFALSLNSDGRFLYVSETVSIYLGLSQVSSVVYKKKM